MMVNVVGPSFDQWGMCATFYFLVFSLHVEQAFFKFPSPNSVVAPQIFFSSHVSLRDYLTSTTSHPSHTSAFREQPPHNHARQITLQYKTERRWSYLQWIRCKQAKQNNKKMSRPPLWYGGMNVAVVKHNVQRLDWFTQARPGSSKSGNNSEKGGNVTNKRICPRSVR